MNRLIKSLVIGMVCLPYFFAAAATAATNPDAVVLNVLAPRGAIPPPPFNVPSKRVTNLDGKTVGGFPTRGPEELPTRVQALRLYTEGSAWFTFEEDRRGALAVGKLADLAVLSKDYLTVPVDEIGGIVSLMTMVGGRIVYAAGPYAALEQKNRRTDKQGRPGP